LQANDKMEIKKILKKAFILLSGFYKKTLLTLQKKGLCFYLSQI